MDFNAGSPVGRRWAKPLAATGQDLMAADTQRCLKRYIARQIYRLLQHPKINT